MSDTSNRQIPEYLSPEGQGAVLLPEGYSENTSDGVAFITNVIGGVREMILGGFISLDDDKLLYLNAADILTQIIGRYIVLRELTDWRLNESSVSPNAELITTPFGRRICGAFSATLIKEVITESA